MLGLMGCLLGLVLASTHASPSAKPTPDALLSRAEAARANDKSRFLVLLKQLKSEEGRLTARQKQQLALLEILNFSREGDFKRTIVLLKKFIAQTKDPTLLIRARSKLASEYMQSRQYMQAFTLFNEVVNDKLDPDNALIRNEIYPQIIYTLNALHQYDEALKYARLMKQYAKSGRARCTAEVAETQTLLYRHDIDSSNPAFAKAIDTCLDSHMLSYANSLRLDRASQMNDEGHPGQALAYLRKIEPDIQKAGYQPQIASLHVTRAQAYLIARKYALARTSALATIASSPPDSMNWIMQSAYKVLYQVQEYAGNDKSALASYKNYLAQYKASTNDAQAQALAYQIVKQEVLAKRLKLEELAKKNKILQLRQSLDRKSSETNRLYVLLLLLVLASIAFWTYRIKHSQIRFRKMARHDDLTGIFSRPYFFERAEHALERLRRSGSSSCLMILDMDHFKHINDAHGHAAGDEVLQHITRICSEHLRDSDLFGRLGGEEFAILMPACTVDQGTHIGERIRSSLANAPVQITESESVTVTCSIGLTGTETHGHALKPLLMAADEALYEAKRTGRDRVVARTGQTSPIRS